MMYRILTATYSERVETLSFDPETKSLSTTSSLTVGYHPSWVTPHPENPAIWFAGLEQEDGRVVVIEYDKEGKGKVIGEVSSEGAEPCTLAAYKGDLLIGNVSLMGFSSLRSSRYSPPRLMDITLRVVFRRKRRRAPLDFFSAVCRIIHDEPFAQRFRSKPGPAALISPSSGDSAYDP